MKIINLTPHDINLYKDGILTRTIKSTGLVRLEEKTITIGEIDGFPVFKKTFGNIDITLEEEKPDTIYIVSLKVAEYLKGLRNDIYVVGDTVRDSNNRICGCTGFCKL